MNTDKSKKSNPTPNRNTFQVNASTRTTGPTKVTPKKSRNPFVTALYIFFLLAAAVGGWLLFALNRPGIEIHNGPTATSGGAFSVQAVAPGQTIAIQNSRPAATPGSSNAAATALVTAPTPTLIIVKSPAKPQIQGYGVVTSKVLNLRNAPNTDATVIKSLKTGDIVELVSRNGGWYETGEGFWISASYMEVRQTRPEAESYARELASS